MPTGASLNEAPPKSHSLDFVRFEEGDVVRYNASPDSCSVLGSWTDWLWLRSSNARFPPFTARARHCDLVRRADSRDGLIGRPSRDCDAPTFQRWPMLETDLATWMVELTAMQARRPVWVWIAASFGGAFALAIAAMPVGRLIGASGISLGLEVSARFAFLLFWLAYVGPALASLFGDAFLPLKSQRAELGLSFAAAMVVHLGLVTSLCLAGRPPPLRTFVIFGAAAGSLICWRFVGPARAGGSADQRMAGNPFVAMNYILLAFIVDFRRPTHGAVEAVKYLPFLALAVSAPVLRLAAWTQKVLRTAALLGSHLQDL